MDKLIFASAISPGRSEMEAITLASSIRTFAGRFSDCPFWVLMPKSKVGIAEGTKRRLLDLDTRLIPYDIEARILAFPFAGKVVASAVAEALAEPETDILAWMDADSMVLNEPLPLILDDRTSLGYRPVNHTLIGSPIDQPLDRFWEHVYRRCHVGEADLFPMTTSVDRNTIRPYFNTGLLVVRPRRRLMRNWRDSFLGIHRDPLIEVLYADNILYKIFVHQAVLAGVILSNLNRAELVELPPSINYPLHMHDQYPSSSRPSYVSELVTCRYDILFQSPDWREKIPTEEPLKSWLDNQVKAMEL